MQQFINHNGKMIPSDQPSVSHTNRAFRYGDALFETIRIVGGIPVFLPEHINRLIDGLRVMKMQTPINLNADILNRLILELLQKNNIGPDGRARFTVYRNNGGFYTPTDNQVSFLLEVYPIEEHGYHLNQKGLEVDLFTDFKKTPNAMASIKSANSAMYVMAGVYKTQHQLDDCVLVNDKGHIIETISSNIFAVKNGVLYTPPVSDGCVNGVMRKKIIEMANANRIAVYENPIMQSVLLSSDELFLTNTIKGIQWVVAYKQKRYFNNMSKKLLEKLNELVGAKVS
jgi:branched-subunit amino acid aminotransferase/4-amino-4-deoxychorismate lyase